MPEITYHSPDDLARQSQPIREAEKWLRSGNPSMSINFETEKTQKEWWRALSSFRTFVFLYRPDPDELTVQLFNLRLLAAQPERYSATIEKIDHLVKRNLKRDVASFAEEEGLDLDNAEMNTALAKLGISKLTRETAAVIADTASDDAALFAAKLLEHQNDKNPSSLSQRGE